MSNIINIEQCKITRDNVNVYLDVITDVLPEDLAFIGFTIQVFSYDKLEIPHEESLDLSGALSDETRQLRLRVPITDIVNKYPGAFYKIQLKAANEINEYSIDAWVSDVHFAYKCMMGSLLKMPLGQCDSVPDDIIRQYLLLYGHVASMREGDLEQAQYFYKKMINCGCGPTIPNKHSCGCKL